MKKLLFLLLIGFSCSFGQSLYLQCPPTLNCVPNITAAGGLTPSSIIGGNNITVSPSGSIVTISQTNNTSITAGNEISVTGNYPNFTISKTGIQTVSVTATPSVYVYSANPNTTMIIGQTTISSAQLLTLTSTTVSIEIIPSPGAGKFIELIDMYGYLNFNTTPYSSTTLTARYKFNEQVLGNFINTWVSGGNSRMIKPLVTVIGATETTWDNTGISIFPSGALTSGDSPITFYYVYYIRSFQ